MIVISDTSPIANLIQINRLEILYYLFDKIIVPPAVDNEVRKLEKFNVDLKAYLSSSWITVVQPNDLNKVTEFLKRVDVGEAEAIVIAKELNADYLLIDERLGTKVAHQEGLNTLVLLGVFIKAKEKEIIGAVLPIINELEEVGFWLSEDVKLLLKKIVAE